MNRRVTVELLEDRRLLAVITVDAHRAVRDVNPQLLGVNVNWWDTQLPRRAPGRWCRRRGSTSSGSPAGPAQRVPLQRPALLQRPRHRRHVCQLHRVGRRRGRRHPQLRHRQPPEGAAWLAYLNANVGDTTVIGTGPQWSNSANAWVQKDWRTAGYWASLRRPAAGAERRAELFRVSRPQPFGLHYFEIGNEMYGTWEVDRHGQGGVPGAPHDPATYVNFAKRFAEYAAQIDPTISIGVNSGSVGTDAGWTRGCCARDRRSASSPASSATTCTCKPPGRRATPTCSARRSPARPATPPPTRSKVRRRLSEPAVAHAGRRGGERRAAGHRVQLRLLQPRQADDESCERLYLPPTRSAGCSRRSTTAPTSGTCVTASTPATTIPPPLWLAAGRRLRPARHRLRPPARHRHLRPVPDVLRPPARLQAGPRRRRGAVRGPTTPTSPLRRAPVGRRPAPAGDQQAPDGGPGAAGDGQRVPARRLARAWQYGKAEDTAQSRTTDGRGADDIDALVVTERHGLQLHVPVLFDDGDRAVARRRWWGGTCSTTTAPSTAATSRPTRPTTPRSPPTSGRCRRGSRRRLRTSPATAAGSTDHARRGANLRATPSRRTSSSRRPRGPMPRRGRPHPRPRQWLAAPVRASAVPTGSRWSGPTAQSATRGCV